MFGSVRSISFTAQVMIPILGLIFFGIAWVLPGNMQAGDVYGGGFYHLPDEGWLYPLWMQMARLPLWARILPSFLLSVITAALMVRTDMDNLLMGMRSYAIAFVFLFLLCSGGHFFLFHPAMLAGYFMVLSYRFLLDLYKDETGYSIVFAMGFSWGTAILLYPPVALLIPAILIGLLLMVTTNWRHWVVILMGLSVPALLVSIFWLLMGDLGYEANAFFSWFDIRQSFLPGFISMEPVMAAWLGLIMIWAIVASVKYRNPKIQSRQLFQANFILFVSMLLIALFLESVSAEILWLLTIPLSYMMTFWVLKVERGWVRDLFFFSLLLSFALYRIYHLI